MLKIAALLALVAACASAILAARTTYKDVPKSNWAAESVKMVTDAGIMQGGP